MKRTANEDEGRKSKRLKKSDSESSKPETYEEGETGIIEKVTVQNFMCHENFSLNFRPHMNFIIGQNGSGKSAILTAIILALGGKSSKTDRFTNIKGFIKRGKNKGKIEVVLRNRGNLAYKPDVYGEKITVIREFTKEGAGTYKIKSESGTICSTQKTELQNIMDAMDIMVECPVCILTQATSKRFLISKDAKAERLFEFFYKGTGLEALENQYKQTGLDKAAAEAELEKKKQALPELKKEVSKWKKFLDASKKITDIKNEMLWASVIEMEKQVQEKEEEYRRAEKVFEEHKKDMELCQKSYNEKGSELDELNKQKSDLDTEMMECRRKLKDLNAELGDHSSSYRRAKGTLERLENEKKKLEEDIADLEKCIMTQRLKDQKHLEEERNKCKEAVEKLMAENSNLEEKVDTLNGTISTKRNEHRNMVEAVDNLRIERNQHHFAAKKIQDILTTTRNAVKNKDNAFGEHTDNVLMAIQNENKFIKQPIGPIGKYLEIKDPRWAAAVEFAINSSMLNSFCVDNHQDSRLLRDILRRFYSKPPAIIVSPYESHRFNVQQGRVQSSFPAVLDMLIVKDHRIENCLIDQCQIEKKILVENEKERANLMRHPPTNCHSAYFMNCDQVCFNPTRIYSYGKKALSTRLRGMRSEALGAIQMEVVADVYQHQQQTQQQLQRNIQSTQTRPYSSAERQRRCRAKKKAAKMNACTTFSQSSDVQPQQEQPQHDVQINKRQANAKENAERQRKHRKLLRERKQQQQQMEDINAVTVLIHASSSIHQLQKELESDLEKEMNALNVLHKKIENMENNVKSYPEIIHKLELEVLKIKADLRRNMMEINDLQCKEETKNVDSLEEDLENLRQDHKKKEEEIKNCLEQVSDLEAKRTEFKKQIDSESATLQSLNENFNRLHTKIGDVSKRKESLALGKRKYELERKCKENICKNHQTQWEDCESKLEILRSKTEKVCPRINTDKSPEELACRIEQFENQVKEKSQCDRENLRKKYEEKLENIIRAERDEKRIEGVLIRIGEMLKRRIAKLNEIRKNTALLISLTFTTILAGNGYKGFLDFEQDKRVLNMKDVAPRAGESARRNHSSLSGGERSFVTIAFLLALWERTKMPFRILDEYDVFMDSSNRQLCIDLLNKKAKEMCKTQFILLSPLELPGMKESNDFINILRIAAPKRQTEDNENLPRKKLS